MKFVFLLAFVFGFLLSAGPVQPLGPEAVAVLITALVPFIQLGVRKLIVDSKRVNIILPQITGVLLAVAAHLSGNDPVGVEGFWGSAAAGLVLGALGRFGRDVLTHGLKPIIEGAVRGLRR